MRKPWKLALIVLILSALLFTACTGEPEPVVVEPVETPIEVYEPPVELVPLTEAFGAIAYEHLTYMGEYLPNRFPFTLRERETAEWIMRELIDMGHDPENIQMQLFPMNELMLTLVATLETGEDEDPLEEIPEEVQGLLEGLDVLSMEQVLALEFVEFSQNVILTVPGVSERRIIVGAHYDSPNNAGISDNASGVAVLLESAARILHVEHYYTITYIFFGAEEIGLVGALYYVENLTTAEAENIALMVNVDVIFDGSTLTYGVGYHDFALEAEGSNAVTALIEGIAADLNAEYDFGLVRQPGGVYVASDQLAFLFAGFDVLVFYAVDGFEPSPAMAGIVVGIVPELDLERLDLMLAILEESDEAEIVAAIDADRDALEVLLMGFGQVPEGVMQEQLEMVEGLVEEMDDPAFLERIYEELTLLRTMVLLVEHPALSDFVPGLRESVTREEGDERPIGRPGFGYVLHTENDQLAFLHETFPGLVKKALQAYSLFLERVLTLPAGSLA